MAISAHLQKRIRKALARKTFGWRTKTASSSPLQAGAVAAAAVAAIEQGDRSSLIQALSDIDAAGRMDGHVAGLLLRALVRCRGFDLLDLAMPPIARCMASPGWDTALEGVLLALNDRDLALAMRAAIVDDVSQNSGARALDACLSAPASAPLTERLSVLKQLERVAPELCGERPVRAALRSLPQPRDGALRPEDVAEKLRNAGERILVVAGPDINIADLDVLPGSSAIILTAYRPIRTVLEGWRGELAARNAQDRIQVVDSLQHDSDLNDALHRRLSDGADELAGAVMRAQEFLIDPRLRAFCERHGETATIKLSDRLFAWMRVQAAFVQVLRMTRPTTVLMLDAGEEALLAASASVAITSPLTSRLEVRSGRALRSLMRSPATTSTPEIPFAVIPDTSLGDMVEQGQSVGAEKRRLWSSEAKGLILSTPSSLHAPMAQRMASVLGTSAVDVSDLLKARGEARRPLACHLSPSRVLEWMNEVGFGETAAELAVDPLSVSQLLASMIKRFIEVDLVRLMEVDALTTGAIQACPPQFAIVLPTRHPELRVAARNCQVHGTKVHEIQAVYLSEMPRYRPPVVDRYHALDTFSAEQLHRLFGLPASAVRVGGSLRSFPVQLATPRSPGAPFRITLATQPEPIAQSVMRLSETLDALRTVLTPWSLTLRPHPAEGALRLDAYRDVFEQAGVASRFGGNLADTDLLVAGFSNLVMEATTAGIRVAIHLPQGASPIPFDAIGVANKTSTPAALAAFIEDCVRDGPLSTALDASSRRYMAQNTFLGRPDEAAAAIAAEILGDLRP